MHRTNNIAFITSVIVLYLVSYGFDTVMDLAQESAKMTLRMDALLWFSVATGMIFAALVISITWLVFRQSNLSKLPAIAVALIGLSVILSPTPIFSALRVEYLHPLGIRLLAASPTSFVFTASTFTFVLGVLSTAKAIAAQKSGPRRGNQTK